MAPPLAGGAGLVVARIQPDGVEETAQAHAVCAAEFHDSAVGQQAIRLATDAALHPQTVALAEAQFGGGFDQAFRGACGGGIVKIPLAAILAWLHAVQIAVGGIHVLRKHFRG